MQSLSFKMKIVNSASDYNVAEKEVTSFMLLTAAIGTPFKLLSLLGLLLQRCNFCILTNFSENKGL